MQPGLSIATARRLLAQSLRAQGVDTPELDARLLVGHALGLDHAGLASAGERLLTAAEADALAAFAARRQAREPVARILGRKEFWGLTLHLNPATLVPRPETETVVEAALAALSHNRTQRLADLGTGSGALLLALLSELPAAHGIGTDVAAEALRCARTNAAALGLGARASFVACDYGSALKGPFDLIVCNPPYIVHDDIASLAPEVRDFDPHAALDGGSDGLSAYRALIPEAACLLAPGAALVVEAGEGQSGPIEGLMSAAGLTPAGAPRADLAGIKRAVAGRKMPR